MINKNNKTGPVAGSSLDAFIGEATGSAIPPSRVIDTYSLILLNTPIIADKIFKGEFHEIKGIMEKSRELGMRTFDWPLFDLYNDGHISCEEAIRNADSANELRLNIKLKSQRGEPASASSGPDLSLHEYKSPKELEEERLAELAAQEEHKRQFEAAQLARQQQEKQQQESAQTEKPPPVIVLDKLQLALE